MSVTNPITGEEPLQYDVELSRMDVKRFFIETQLASVTTLALIWGADKLEASLVMGFEEFKRCVALCGMCLFRNVTGMAPAERVQAMLDVYLGPQSDPHLGTSAVRLANAVHTCLANSLRRFEPTTGLEERLLSRMSEEWLRTWGKLDLKDVHGWPLWEKEVCARGACAYRPS